jgi:phosphoglycerate dehydrogenase-like enzyme
MPRLAILDDYQAAAAHLTDWSTLAGVETTIYRDHLADEDAVQARLEPYDLLLAMRERTPFPASLLRRLPRLRLLVTTGVRNRSIDVAAANECGVTVCGTRMGGNGTTELTWGLILGLLRRIPAEDRNVRAGGWQETVGVDLIGRRLGVLGLGKIGRQVAAVGRAFGMEVLAWSQHLTEADAAAAGARWVTKEDLLRQADVLTIHLVLSERTRGLLGARELGLLQRTAYLVNTSRGPIVEEPALIEALASGRIAGAALDVFDVEPLPPGHPLRALPNTIVTPHLGYVTEASYRAFFRDAREDITAFLAGDPVRVLTPA